MTDSSQPPAAPRPELPPRRVNRAAVASLVFGILGCVPELAGLLAILFGLIGLRRARKQNIGGKGLAGAGLALGIVSVVVWSISIATVGWAWSASGPARAVTRQYLRDLSHQDIAALMNASTSVVTEAQVQALSDRFRLLGNFQDLQFTGVFLAFPSGQPQFTLTGRAWYANGEAEFKIAVVHQGDAWKVNAFWIRGRLRNGQPMPENLEV